MHCKEGKMRSKDQQGAEREPKTTAAARKKRTPEVECESVCGSSLAVWSPHQGLAALWKVLQVDLKRCRAKLRFWSS